MIGYHAVPVIADAYMKGIRGFDADAGARGDGRERQLRSLRRPREYMELGYVPIDEEGEAASKTLEYAYDDWTIARMAEAMGRKDIAAQFEQARGELAQQLRSRDRLHARAQARRQLPRALRSDRQRLRHPTTPRATPGSTRGTCRRTWPAWSRRTAATRQAAREARRDVRRQGRSEDCSRTWRTSPA